MSPKTNGDQPNWQPLSSLPMIARLIDGQAMDAKKQYATLLKAHDNPYTLDDATIERIIKVYTEQRDFLWVFREQLAKWQEETLTAAQKKEIDRLQLQMESYSKTLTDILKLANELKHETIEKLLTKSDLELGIEALIRMKKI